MGGKKKKGRQKKKQERSEDTLANTTKEILKQCRSNPHANVRLSGKKRRKLEIIARREAKKQLAMEVSKPSEKLKNIKEDITEKMETS